MLLCVPPPPQPVQYAHELPAGTRVAAGLGWSTVTPEIDFETYSEAGFVWNEDARKWGALPKATQGKKGLKVVGARPYAEHASTEVLCMAYDLKDGRGWRHWRPGKPVPFDLLMYLARGGLIEAHNNMFERYIWRYVCERKYGFPAVDPRQWRCSMAKARASSAPGALDDVSDVFATKIRKDKDGKRLLDKFSIPRNPTAKDPRRRIHPVDVDAPGAAAHPDYSDTMLLYFRYNPTDIHAEAEVSALFPDLEGEELAWWQEDQEINDRGVRIDNDSLLSCIAVIEQCHDRYNEEFYALTGIPRPSMLEQLKAWLLRWGVVMASMDEEDILERLKDATLPAPARRALELRAIVGSAAVKKVFSMRNRLNSRLRLCDLFIYYGARTGRVTGDGPQPTNMPSGGPRVYKCICGRWHGIHTQVCPWCNTQRPPDPPGTKADERGKEWSPEAVEDALSIIAHRDIRTLERFFGDAMKAVSGCIRGLYIADDGLDFISSDYSSIEAVGLAMISGERWRIDTFRGHGKIYETSAARMFGVSFEEFMRTEGYTDAELQVSNWWEQNKGKPRDPTGRKHKLRKTGKVAELALGYQGWLGAAKAFEMEGTDDEIKAQILAWRKASPCVEWLWGGQTRGQANQVGFNAGLQVEMSYRGDGPNRWDRTPYYFGCEGMAIKACLFPGVPMQVTRMDGTFTGITYLKQGEALYCQLPSGRWLTYHRPRLTPSQRSGHEGEWSLSYEGWNTNPKNGGRGWISMDTWGGRLVENIVQATCRDILRHAILNLRARGYPTVLHVYDEIVAEVAKWFGSVQEFEQIMATPPAWAHDWPLRATGGWRGRRYRKG